jgi:hypothetical protein
MPRKLIIKRAVAKDSLSAGIKHIESIRLRILERFLVTAELSAQERECSEKEFVRKKTIVKVF